MRTLSPKLSQVLSRAATLALCVLLLLTTPITSAPARQDAPAAPNAPLSTAFTYQGRLEKGGALVTAACAMTFSLFDAATEGNQIGNDQTINPVEVSNGLFMVALHGSGEFGADAFGGSARFLQIAVLCPGDASAVTLPRQQLTAAPYALTSLSTEGLQGRPVSAAAPATGQALAWDGTQWTPQTIGSGSPNDWSTLSGIPAGFDDDVDNDSGGDVTAVVAGSGLTGGGTAGDVGLTLDTAVTDNLYWQLDGNGGVPSTGFLGTTDNVSLTFKVSNTTGLRIEAGATPNLLGGNEVNTVAVGVVGATIAGGGLAPGDANEIFDSFGTIGGGQNNVVGVNDGSVTNQFVATIAGGRGNQATATAAFVGGGQFNIASGQQSVISGGRINEATAQYATITGGEGAMASLRGQFAYANGGFTDNFNIQDVGSAQTSIYVLRNDGVGNLTLFLDGDNDVLSVRAGSSMAFMIHVIGRSNTGTEITAAYRIDGAISANDAGNTTTLVGGPTVTTLGEVGFGGNLLANVTAVSGGLSINVENGSGQNMRWVATVYATEVVED